MNKKYFRLAFCASFMQLFCMNIHTIEQNSLDIKNVLDTKLKNQSLPTTEEKTVWFKYKEEPLVSIVNDLATQLGINIMLPTGPNALTTKVTFEFSHKISLKKAWQHVITLLKISGFTIVPHVGFSSIVKNDANINKEPLPLFVNVPTASIPKTDLKIRYLRYLSNIQVPEGSGGGFPGGAKNPLQTIMSDILSADAQLIYEPQLNAMVITDFARNIKSIMEIIDELDSSTIVQDMQVLHLEHAAANHVKTLFDQLIGSSTSQTPGPQQATNNSGYFAKSTKIIPLSSSNSLIILGKKEALVRVVTFIKKHIDIPKEDGQSVLHIYDLNYLKADDFVPVLKGIVEDSSSSSSGSYDGYGSGTNQSSSSSSGQTTSFFENVIITSEGATLDTSGGSDQASKGVQGGNRLIVAATEKDWTRIKKLIIELDQPPIQVVIQGLIVDLTETGTKNLTTQIRDNKNLFFKDDVHFQAAHTGSILKEGTGPNALQSNLAATGSPLVSAALTGSTLLSVTDPATNGIWLLTNMLKSSTDAKILSQPYLTTINHKQINFSSAEKRWVDGPTEPTYGSSKIQKQVEKTAAIEINVLPTISENGTINLGIYMNVDEWTNNAQNDNGGTLNRKITTNANIKSGDILVIGGLTKTKTDSTTYKTPLLGDVPIIKHLFSGKKQTTTKTNLMLFLRAEVQYGTNKNISTFSQFKMDEALDIIKTNDEENFAHLKDPITRWFFDDEKKITTDGIKNFTESIRSGRENRINIFQNEENTEAKVHVALPMPEKIERELEEEELKENTQERERKEKRSPKKLTKLSLEAEEKQAEEELEHLFHWDSTSTTKDESLVSKPLVPLEEKDSSKEKKSGPQAKSTIATAHKKEAVHLSEEEVAQQKLQEMFQNFKG